MSRRNEIIGVSEPDNLIFDDKFPLDVKSVNIVSGQGLLKRGALIAIPDDGEGLLWSETAGEIADCILCDDLDTGDTATADIFVGTAYRSGHFIRQSIIVAEGVELTDAAETELRNGGIYLSNAQI